MREIIYIQAGPLSNYTGTHYWNTQESYFVYDEDDTAIVDYNISFKEGRDGHNQPTLFPRLLAFDQKSNFGTLTRDSHLGNELGRRTESWDGDIILQEREQISLSEYHSRLDIEGDIEPTEPICTNIRYWSDFSRVFFDSKSVQAVPDVPDFVEGDWNTSCEAFSRYDNDSELMDGSLRLLIEECNNFQGIQMIQDTPIFGGFSDSLLSAFREEHPKVTIMTLACLSNITPLNASLTDSSQIMRVINDSISLQRLAGFCDLTIPILSPPLWGENCWYPGYNTDGKSLYETSAILSAHMETATLPMRLKNGSNNLQTTVAHLNWRKSSPFALLGGTLYPRGLYSENVQDIAYLSFHPDESCKRDKYAQVPRQSQTFFARKDVSRGLSKDEEIVYDKWRRSYGLKEPFLTWYHLPDYPIPTSFPPIFSHTRPSKTLKMTSSLLTSSGTRGHLSNYAHFVEGVMKRRDGALLTAGLEDDDARELLTALWDIVDEYDENEESDSRLNENIGEDEV